MKTILSVCETAFGWVGIAASPQGLARLTLPKPGKGEALAELRESYPEGMLVEEKFEGLKDKLRRYFAGERVEFKEPLDLSGLTPFQTQVLAACSTIPYGQTRSYRWLAERAASPRASRAAGQVMARNPLPIIIPCHRVVGANGSLTGFGGGLDLKQRLLDLEAGRPSLPGGHIPERP